MPNLFGRVQSEPQCSSLWPYLERAVLAFISQLCRQAAAVHNSANPRIAILATFQHDELFMHQHAELSSPCQAAWTGTGLYASTLRQDFATVACAVNLVTSDNAL